MLPPTLTQTKNCCSWNDQMLSRRERERERELQKLSAKRLTVSRTKKTNKMTRPLQEFFLVQPEDKFEHNSTDLHTKRPTQREYNPH
jgi:hypothetical protein